MSRPVPANEPWNAPSIFCTCSLGVVGWGSTCNRKGFNVKVDIASDCYVVNLT